jgi:hypothetical protein
MLKFVEADLEVEEVEASRTIVVKLPRPAATVMDFNIVSVLWHASRAQANFREIKILTVKLNHQPLDMQQAQRHKKKKSSLRSLTIIRV